MNSSPRCAIVVVVRVRGRASSSPNSIRFVLPNFRPPPDPGSSATCSADPRHIRWYCLFLARFTFCTVYFLVTTSIAIAPVDLLPGTRLSLVFLAVLPITSSKMMFPLLLGLAMCCWRQFFGENHREPEEERGGCAGDVEWECSRSACYEEQSEIEEREGKARRLLECHRLQGCSSESNSISNCPRSGSWRDSRERPAAQAEGPRGRNEKGRFNNKDRNCTRNRWIHGKQSKSIILSSIEQPHSSIHHGPAWNSPLLHGENEKEVLSALICLLGERNVAKTV